MMMMRLNMKRKNFFQKVMMKNWDELLYSSIFLKISSLTLLVWLWLRKVCSPRFHWKVRREDKSVVFHCKSSFFLWFNSCCTYFRSRVLTNLLNHTASVNFMPRRHEKVLLDSETATSAQQTTCSKECKQMNDERSDGSVTPSSLDSSKKKLYLQSVGLCIL